MKQRGANRRRWKRSTTSADQIPGADRQPGGDRLAGGYRLPGDYRFGRYVIDQLFQQTGIANAAPIPVEQPQIGQQRALKQLPFGHDAISPALALGVGRGDRLLASDVRSMEFPRRLDLQQIVRRILHLDEKVGNDVSNSDIAPTTSPFRYAR